MSNQYEQAHAAERAAAKKMELGNHKVTLIIAIVVWVAYLVLPYAGPAHGWEALQLGTTDDGRGSPSWKLSPHGSPSWALAC